MRECTISGLLWNVCFCEGLHSSTPAQCYYCEFANPPLKNRIVYYFKTKLCSPSWGEMGCTRGWTWEMGPVGWLHVQFEDHGILALAGSAWQKVSSCLSRRGADSPVIVFRPPVSCLSSTCLCVGRKILLKLKKSFNRNFFSPRNVHWTLSQS